MNSRGLEGRGLPSISPSSIGPPSATLGPDARRLASGGQPGKPQVLRPRRPPFSPCRRAPSNYFTSTRTARTMR